MVGRLRSSLRAVCVSRDAFGAVRRPAAKELRRQRGRLRVKPANVGDERWRGMVIHQSHRAAAEASARHAGSNTTRGLARERDHGIELRTRNFEIVSHARVALVDQLSEQLGVAGLRAAAARWVRSFSVTPRPGWRIGRRARLRIAKSSISMRRFSFHCVPLFRKTGLS